mgnify:CR=1 FL=1
MWTHLLLAPALAAAEPIVFSLAGPQDAKAGDTLYTAGDNVRIRKGPSTDAHVIATVRLGTALTVQAGEVVHDDIGERASVWLPVKVNGKTGHVWAGALTRARLTVDLDEDGEDELVTASFNTLGEVVVRTLEPSVEGPEAVGFVKFGPFHDINGVMERATLSAVPKAEAGLPLARVETLAGEYCGSGSFFNYVSHRSAAKGVPGSTRRALNHRGSGGDSPVWWSTEVAFSPANRQVTITRESGEDDSTLERSVAVLTLHEGVFVAPEASPQ